MATSTTTPPAHKPKSLSRHWRALIVKVSTKLNGSQHGRHSDIYGTKTSRRRHQRVTGSSSDSEESVGGYLNGSDATTPSTSNCGSPLIQTKPLVLHLDDNSTKKSPPCQRSSSAVQDSSPNVPANLAMTEPDEIDQLRASSYTRLGNQVYVDYMGGCLLPETLVKAHANFLEKHLLGNTHSDSPSSRNSSFYVSQARAEVLKFFDAPEDQYTVVFTASTTHSLKLVAESYLFTAENSLILPIDAHNSVHGIRCFAHRAGSQVHYLDSTICGGVDVGMTKKTLANLARRNTPHPSLVVLTGQSNVTNSKTPLSLADYASSLGYHVLLDAAALAPTSRMSLRSAPGVDAMAISFYKMFGYPTGIGALVVKKEFLNWLSAGNDITPTDPGTSLTTGRKVWFAGGTVDVVQVPGKVYTLAHELHERFEEGTINYLAFPAIVNGLRLLDPLMDRLKERLEKLVMHLVVSLSSLRYPSGTSVVRVLSRTPFHAMQQAPKTEKVGAGSILALLFYDEQGEPIPLSLVSYCAYKHNISLRTGCMCNPGGATAMLGLCEYMSSLQPGATLKGLEKLAGRELGVVRMSLGLVSDWADVERVIEFARVMGDEEKRARFAEEREKEQQTETETKVCC